MSVDPFKQLELLKEKDSRLLQHISEIQITSNEERKSYEDDLISARNAYNKAEEMRKSFVNPLRLSEQRINALFKPYLSRIGTGISQISMALDKWRKEQVNKTEEEMLTEAQLYWKRKAEAKTTGEVVPLPELNAVIQPKTSHVNMGSVTYREFYDIQIITPDLVPRELCDPSIKKIRAKVDLNELDIPGVLVTRKYVPFTRGYK